MWNNYPRPLLLAKTWAFPCMKVVRATVVVLLTEFVKPCISSDRACGDTGNSSLWTTRPLTAAATISVKVASFAIKSNTLSTAPTFGPFTFGIFILSLKLKIILQNLVNIPYSVNKEFQNNIFLKYNYPAAGVSHAN